MASDSDPGAVRIASCHRMKDSGRGAMRWAVTIVPEDGRAYGAVLYYDPDRRKWGLSRSARLSEKAGRMVDQKYSDILTPDFGVIPAGQKVTAVAISKLLPPRAHAEAAAAAMKRSRK